MPVNPRDSRSDEQKQFDERNVREREALNKKQDEGKMRRKGEHEDAAGRAQAGVKEQDRQEVLAKKADVTFRKKKKPEKPRPLKLKKKSSASTAFRSRRFALLMPKALQSIFRTAFASGN